MTARDRRTSRGGRKRNRDPRGRPDAAAPGTTPARRKRAGISSAWILRLGAALAVVALGTWAVLHLRERSERRAPASGDSGLSSQALFDSVVAASKRRDFERALLLSNQLAEREPRNPIALLTLATQWNDFAWGGAAFERARPPVRNSLERVRIFKFAFALLDSAMGVEPRPTEVVDIRRTRGQLYELVGLPTDALAIYLDVMKKGPRNEATLKRRSWVTNHLRDPLTSDEEWMKRAAARGESPP